MNGRISFVTKELVYCLQNHFNGRSKCSITFKFINDYIIMQSSNEFVYCSYIKAKFDNSYIGLTFSVMIDNSIDFLQMKHENTYMCIISNNNKDSNSFMQNIIRNSDNSVIDGYVYIEQNGLSLPFNIVQDSFIDIGSSDIISYGLLDSSVLKSILDSVKNLVSVSKSLDIGNSSIFVKDGIVYNLYSNTMIINKFHQNFPNVEIPYNTFNKICKCCSGIIDVRYDLEKSILYLYQPDGMSYLAISCKASNKQFLEAVDLRVNKSKDYGIFSFDDSKMLLGEVYKRFPKESVILNFSRDNRISCKISLPNNKSIYIGETSDVYLSIVLSSAQLEAFYKTFKSYKSICLSDCGNDVIKFSDLSSSINFVVSGMVLKEGDLIG